MSLLTKHANLVSIRGVPRVVQSNVKMRFQAAILFVLLAATCCLAADHLLRQQHEQELLKAKVSDLGSAVAAISSCTWLKVLNPLCQFAGQSKASVCRVDVEAQQGLLKRRKGAYLLRVGTGLNWTHQGPPTTADCPCHRRRSSASAHGPTTCATLKSTTPNIHPTG